MGVSDIDPLSDAGAYVEPDAWNALIADPDTVVIDTRNDYEVALGAFRNAVDPATATFREFPDWVANNRQALEGRKIAMYCTGGIRCEKATAYVRSLGLRRGLSPQGRHPEISGDRARRAEPLAGRVLRVRRARFRDAWAGRRRGRALPRLPASADGRRPQLAALSRGHLLRSLPRCAQRRRPRPLCRAAAAGAAGGRARRWRTSAARQRLDGAIAARHCNVAIHCLRR